MFDLLQKRDEGPAPTFAEPGGNSGFAETLGRAAAALAGGPSHIGLELARNPQAYRDLFGAAERQTALVDNITARNFATEEAYDRRIKAVKDATGEELLNPLRGGYWPTLRERRDAMGEDGTPTDVRTLAAGKFENVLADLLAKNPDKAEALQFGDINAEAKAIAAGSEKDYAAARQNPKLDPVAGLLTEFAGGMWGQRRDPLFVGSLFLGPTSAVGKSTIARIASSGIFQGLYNAGISALEQPAVQAWRQEIGVKSGVMPAVENVGMAFLFGVIPGAAIRAAHEMSAAARQATQRVLSGHPEPGDVETALRATGAGMTPEQTAAIRMGEDMQAADRATAPPKPKEVSPELHDDMMAAELKRADDPTQPSAQAVAAVSEPELPPEIAARVAEAEPKTLHEAQIAATEAIEEQGNRATMARTRVELDGDRLPAPEPLPEGVKPAPASSKDPLDKIPLARDDGTPTLVSARTAAKAGERETQFAAIIRECK